MAARIARTVETAAPCSVRSARQAATAAESAGNALSGSRMRRYGTSADSESARIRAKRRIIRHDV